MDMCTHRGNLVELYCLKIRIHITNFTPVEQGFKGRKGEGCSGSNYKKPQVKSSECSVSQEQINAWLRINGSKPCIRRQVAPSSNLVLHCSWLSSILHIVAYAMETSKFAAYYSVSWCDKSVY